jgi:hypothetical protein
VLLALMMETIPTYFHPFRQRLPAMKSHENSELLDIAVRRRVS